MECVFCSLPGESKVVEGKLCFAFLDDFPVSPYHALIVPKRHVENFFDLSAAEAAEIFKIAGRLKSALMKLSNPPTGFNVGVNVGRAAGQSVSHVHMHFIPRWPGDSDSPRGGVRAVIQHRKDYGTKKENVGEEGENLRRLLSS